MFPACGWSGSFFTVAWADMRDRDPVAQLRGDIYLARVGADGTVLDPAGVQATSGPLPEDLPAVTGRADACIVAFSMMDGSCGNPEVQRMGYTVLRELDASGVEDPVEARFTLCAGPNPFRDRLHISWQDRVESASDPIPEIEILGVDGRRVWSTRLDAGSGTLTWDGRTQSGHAAPSGAYFLRLTSDREGEAVRVLRSR
jgi:hypothetical protein